MSHGPAYPCTESNCCANGGPCRACLPEPLAEVEAVLSRALKGHVQPEAAPCLLKAAVEIGQHLGVPGLHEFERRRRERAIQAAAAQGLTPVQIAQRVGVSASQVRRVLATP